MIDKSTFNWSKVFYVKVDDIKYLSTDRIFLHKHWGKDFGSILNYDFPIIPFDRNNFLIQSLKQFLFEDIDITNTHEWETAKYQDVLKDIKAGHNIYFHSEEQFKERLEYKWNNVYQSLKKHGAKSQDEIASTDIRLVRHKDLSDDIAVVITKEGKLALFNGHHRLSCAVLLGIKYLPLRVGVRHKEWVDFIIETKEFNKSQWGDCNKTYQTFDHIDFRGFEAEWGNYRFNKIKENITSKGTLLDIGALWGEFSTRFEKELGFKCTAVELNGGMCKVMNKMKVANECSFEVKYQDLCTLEHYKYDVILALNIWHHFLKTKEMYNRLKVLLSKLECKELFFQAHSISEGQMDKAYRNYTPEEFVKFIVNNCPRLSTYEVIGEERNRKLYRIT